MKDKKTITILTLFTLILTFFGGTLAYWNWSTNSAQQTNVTFTVTRDFSCAADGGGNISSTENKLAPADCLNTTYAIQRTVTVTPTINRTGLTVYMDLWLTIDSIGEGLTNSENFRYALTESATSCVTNPIASGTFNELVDDNKVRLLDQQPYTTSGPKTYYLYVWLDKEETSTDTMDQPFNLILGGQCSDTRNVYQEEILNGTGPVLETGMIPVTLSDTGVVTTVSQTDSNWYSYTDKEWANAVLVKENASSETGSHSRNYYLEHPGIRVLESDILAYYVWIPRYKYTFPKADGNPETISIIFENKSTPKSVPASGSASGTEYYTHPAFTFGTNNELNGIWVGKFETSHTTLSSNTTYNNLGCTTTDCENANGLIIKPSKNSLRRNDLLNYFYASRSMTTTNNPFGLTTETDTHMMKNSEWGAVVYLSHSQYGINQEIEGNPSRYGAYITGLGSNYYGVPGTGANTYPQSTTGNITGVFDMSAGLDESIMGNYNGNIGNSSDFITLPDSKYYDKYTVDSFDSCTLSECGGHALYETKGWYSDNAGFVNSNNPWFTRGGNASGATSTASDYTGAFYSASYDGTGTPYQGFRSVAIKGA